MKSNVKPITLTKEILGDLIKVTQHYQPNNGWGYIHASREDKDGNLIKTYSTSGRPQATKITDEMMEDLFWAFLAGHVELIKKSMTRGKAFDMQIREDLEYGRYKKGKTE